MDPEHYSERFPELANFLAGNFHQDWAFLNNSNDWRSVVHAYCEVATPFEKGRVIRELEEFMALRLYEKRLYEVLCSVFLSNYYAPGDGLTFEGWLKRLHDELLQCYSGSTKLNSERDLKT